MQNLSISGKLGGEIVFRNTNIVGWSIRGTDFCIHHKFIQSFSIFVVMSVVIIVATYLIGVTSGQLCLLVNFSV